MQQQYTDEIVDTNGASSITGAAVGTLVKWRWAGKGPRFVKIGRLVRYRRSELERWLTEAERTSTSDNGRAAARE